MFYYKIKNEKCYFRRKNLKNILTVLSVCCVDHRIEGEDAYRYLDNYYADYLKRGKQNYDFNVYLYHIKSKLEQYVYRRDFNKVIREIRGVIDE